MNLEMFDTSNIYGLDNWISSPPFSAILAIFLLLGCDRIGYGFLKFLGLIQNKSSLAIRFQAIPLGVMLIAIFLYPMALIQATPLLLMQFFALIVTFIGIYHFIVSIKITPNIVYKNQIAIVKQNTNYDFLLSLVIIFSLFLLSLGPVSSNDSNDYHMGYAIAILNHGGMPFIPEWFLGRYSANGEVINALGLSIGSEQFGSLIQWASLISITALVWPSIDVIKKNKNLSGWLIVLAVLSAPVILFLIPTQKPQLWPIALTSFAFYLFVTSTNEISNKQLKNRFALVCMLCMCASQARFNHLLGGGVVGSLMLFLMLKEGQLKAAISIFFLTAIFILLPPVLWKLNTLDTSLFEIFTNPLPGGLPGTDEAIQNWRKETDNYSSFPFPISIILPSSLGAISSVLGLGWVTFLFYKPTASIINRLGFFSILFTVIFISFVAPPAARMYLEPYFWSLILCSEAIKKNQLLLPKYIYWILRSQALLFLALAIISSVMLFPGALKDTWRKEILERSANGYDLMLWVDNELPKDAVLINSHRSMALVPRKAFNNFIWTSYVDINSKDAYIYLNRIKDIEPTHILILHEITKDTPMINCSGKIYSGPEKIRVAARNPMNAGTTYNAWLLEFNNNLMPECAINK